MKLPNAYAWSGESPYFGKVQFKPRDVELKERSDWSLDDIFHYVITPIVKKTGSFYVDYINNKRRVGNPFEGTYVSASRKTCFSSLVDTLVTYFREKETKAGKKSKKSKKESVLGVPTNVLDSYVWLDVFSVKAPMSSDDRKYLLESGLSQLISQFQDRVVFFQSWVDPYPLRDAWCVWEIYCASKLNIAQTEASMANMLADTKGSKRKQELFEILLPKEEQEGLVDTLVHEYETITSSVKSLDANNAKCQDPNDEKHIRDVLNSVCKNNRRHRLAHIDEVLDVEDVKQFSKKYRSKRRNRMFVDSMQGNNYEEINRIIKEKIWTWLATAAVSAARTALKEIKKKGNDAINSQRIKLVGCAGTILQETGRFEEAKDYMKITLKLSKRYFGEGSEDFALRLNNLGSLYKAVGKLDSALDFYIESLNIRKRLHGKNHTSVSVCLNNISLLLHQKGRFDDAITCQKKALAIDKENFGDFHEEIATDLTNLGNLYSELKKFEEALNLMNQSLEITLQLHGKHHPKVAAVYNNLAALYSDKKQIFRAIKYQRRALKIDVKTYGSNHLEVATDLSNLATYLSLLKKTSEKSTIVESGGVKDTSVGSLAEKGDTKGKLDGMNNMSIEFSENMLTAGKATEEIMSPDEAMDEAIKCFFEAIEIKVAAYGKFHASVATALNNMAFVFKEKGNELKAKKYGIRAMHILERVYGRKHQYTRAARDTWYDKEVDLIEQQRQGKRREGKSAAEKVKKVVEVPVMVEKKEEAIDGAEVGGQARRKSSLVVVIKQSKVPDFETMMQEPVEENKAIVTSTGPAKSDQESKGDETRVHVSELSVPVEPLTGEAVGLAAKKEPAELDQLATPVPLAPPVVVTKDSKTEVENKHSTAVASSKMEEVETKVEVIAKSTDELSSEKQPVAPETGEGKSLLKTESWYLLKELKTVKDRDVKRKSRNVIRVRTESLEADLKRNTSSRRTKRSMFNKKRPMSTVFTVSNIGQTMRNRKSFRGIESDNAFLKPGYGDSAFSLPDSASESSMGLGDITDEELFTQDGETDLEDSEYPERVEEALGLAEATLDQLSLKAGFFQSFKKSRLGRTLSFSKSRSRGFLGSSIRKKKSEKKTRNPKPPKLPRAPKKSKSLKKSRKTRKQLLEEKEKTINKRSKSASGSDEKTTGSKTPSKEEKMQSFMADLAMLQSFVQTKDSSEEV